jgi:hypothetical protein
MTYYSNTSDIFCYVLILKWGMRWLSELQVVRLRVRIPMVSMEFFIDVILLAALWPLAPAGPVQACNGIAVA